MRRLAALLAVLCAFALTGCGATLYSKSVAVAPHGATRHPNGAVTFRSSGIELSIKAQNLVAKGSLVGIFDVPLGADTSGQSRLAIWMEIVPGDSAVEFDPGEVVVTSTLGGSQRPRGWWGPGVASLSAQSECRCGEPRAGTEVAFSTPFAHRHVRYAEAFGESRQSSPPPPRGSQRVERPTCFVLVFDGVRAGHDFTVSIAGVTRGGRPVAMSPIRFKGTEAIW